MKRCDCGCWQGKEVKESQREREPRPKGRPQEASAAGEEAPRTEKNEG